MIKRKMSGKFTRALVIGFVLNSMFLRLYSEYKQVRTAFFLQLKPETIIVKKQFPLGWSLHHIPAVHCSSCSARAELLPQDRTDNNNNNCTTLPISSSSFSTNAPRTNTTRADNIDIGNSKKRSVLVLYLGPQKTASTTLACAADYWFHDHFAERDNFVSIGHPEGPICGRSVSKTEWVQRNRQAQFFLPHQLVQMVPVAQQQQPNNKNNSNVKQNPSFKLRIHPKFKNKLLDIRKRGKNVFLITELIEGYPGPYFPPSYYIMALNKLHLQTGRRLTLYFSPHDILKAIADALDNDKWAVHAVVGYRAYYDYLPSRYSQLFRPKGKLRMFDKWPGPPYGGEVFRPFSIVEKKPTIKGSVKFTPQIAAKRGMKQLITDVWIQDLFRVWEEERTHPTKQMMDSLQNIPCWDVSVINQDTLPSVTENPNADAFLAFFFCTIFSDKVFPNTCRAVLQANRTTSANPAFPMNSDLLSTSAYVANLIRRGSRNNSLTNTLEKAPSREHVRNRVLQRQRDKGLSDNDFPLACLSAEEEKRILKLSLEVEAKIFPALGTPEAQERHEANFRQAASSKFCHVNTSAVLQDPEWRAFLKSL